MTPRETIEQGRPLSASEVAVIEKILKLSGLSEASVLADQLAGATISRTTTWVMDIEVRAGAVPATEIADGPLPVQALVPNESDYRGELLVWSKQGMITGLEYAYITDEVPEVLPALDEIQVRLV